MFTPKYQLNDRQMAVLLASLVAVMPFSVDAYLPSTLDIARALGAQTHDIERSLSAFMLGVAIGQLSGGSLSDIKGRRNIALKGLLVYVVSSLALVFVQTADQLLLLRLVQALGAGMASVVVGAVVRDNYRGGADVRADRHHYDGGADAGAAAGRAAEQNRRLAFGIRVFVCLRRCRCRGAVCLFAAAQAA